MTILPFDGVSPDVGRAAFIAPGARVIGDVVMGEDSSLWYNVVARGDINPIRIGARTNVQDGTVIHVTSKAFPTNIGDDCLIGHIAIIHGCRLFDRAFVGMGAIVLDGCEIESDGMLAAGALLSPGKRIGAGQLWTGRPAKYVRDLTPEQIAGNQQGVRRYIDNARAHAAAVRAAAAAPAMR